MAGPDTPELAAAAVAAGADVVEIGFPFSDPLADGPTVRLAAERALAQGMGTAACLDCLRTTRERVGVPLVPMTYAALLEAYGWETFAEDVALAGATSLIVADLPVDLRPELRRVQLVAPTSSDERIALAAEQTDGWLYLVTLTGTTGARAELSPELAPLVERTRRLDRCSALRRLRNLDAGARGCGCWPGGRGHRRLGGTPGRGGRRRGSRALCRLASCGYRLSCPTSQSRPVRHASVEASMCSK